MTRIEVVHPSRPRVYVRSFDHDDAARRYAAGERLTELAAEYGVTREAVYQAVRRLRPGLRQKDNDSQRANRTTVCDECGGPAMRLVGTKLKQNPDGRCLCQACRRIALRRRFRFDTAGRLVQVQCALVDCANGERWQPPANFAGHTDYRDVRAKGVHSVCRACNTRTKREWRQRTGRA